MRAWPFLLLAPLLLGQGEPPKEQSKAQPLSLAFKFEFGPMTPQATFKALLAQERAARKQAGATVEVIGYEDTTVLKLLSLQTAERVRLGFDRLDSRGNHELRAFMEQDPSHPSPVLVVPMLAGAPTTNPDAKWIK